MHVGFNVTPAELDTLIGEALQAGYGSVNLYVRAIVLRRNEQAPE